MRVVEGGFPHSEMSGSKLVRSSPNLVAAYHVLHRLSAPRPPPDTLKALDRSHCRSPPPPNDRSHRQKDQSCKARPVIMRSGMMASIPHGANRMVVQRQSPWV